MSGVWVAAAMVAVFGADRPPHGEVLPLPHEQVSLMLDGVEKTRWHFGDDAPRPFLYPFNGPVGTSLTRIGHPGAPDHDHHRGVWFAHHDVEGESFWTEGAKTKIRQRQWLAYEDSDEEAVMAVLLEWVSSAGEIVLEQTVVVGLQPAEDGHAVEIQTMLRTPGSRKQTTLNKTNFGLLAVRMAKSISTRFGGGLLSDSEGRVGEPEIFGKSARWMDYSGNIAVGVDENRRFVTEGVTYFDHPANPNYPSKWHVRKDGWMGASLCMDDALTVTADEPITLRYLLHAHDKGYDAARAKRVHDKFAVRGAYVVGKSKASNIASDVRRVADE